MHHDRLKFPLILTRGSKMADSGKKRIRTSVILPDDLHEKIARLAESNDASVAWVIRQAVIRLLEDQGSGKRLKLAKGAERSKRRGVK